ncbi:hypothetical protein BO71DRAFT_412967 [Aspergillus ellipticus CBS 707.79]|uniref:Cupin 2 conserved barrel domain-containing protein n=1 Tax=Aspergillus ellipticus CBS 707.79 TaxID=1448320 RepID=A0A319CYY1_9EURO|nr:hypothetical protein BO71DRAFT_412967 [Aspergillus ellipticus CBS 707.79]
MADSPLPNPNRYITDNAEDGSSLFSTVLDESLPVVNNLGGALVRLGYAADPSPAVLTHATDLDRYQTALNRCPPPLVPVGGGTHVWYIDTPPEGESPMHRTASLDFVVVVAGEVELTLSSGEQRRLKPGRTGHPAVDSTPVAQP